MYVRVFLPTCVCIYVIYSHVRTYVNARIRTRVRACLFGNYPPHLHPPSRPVQHSTVLAEEVYMMRLIMGNIMGKYRFMNIHENIYDYVARN